ncbi:MAG: hypothetical protein P8Y58_11525, partial [Novosphingobium sp.]
SRAAEGANGYDWSAETRDAVIDLVRQTRARHLKIEFQGGEPTLRCDLIEAHKWFNLAAVAGHEEAAACRAEVADEMTAREIAEAQRRAREWLAAANRVTGLRAA